MQLTGTNLKHKSGRPLTSIAKLGSKVQRVTCQAKLEDSGIFLVMAFELLLGSKKIRGGGQLRRRVEKKLKVLQKAFRDAGGHDGLDMVMISIGVLAHGLPKVRLKWATFSSAETGAVEGIMVTHKNRT